MNSLLMCSVSGHRRLAAGWSWPVLLAFLVLGSLLARAEVMLVPRGEVWKYHNLNADPGAAWRQPGYDDSTWSAGAAPLGAGDAHIVTSINIGPSGGRYPTVYVRRTFNVTSAGDYEGLVLHLLRDDGAAVYLNGTLLLADGATVPSAHTAFATQIVDGANEATYFASTAPATALVDGVNVLAVEVKQANTTSSDLGFDLEVRGLLDETPPTLLEMEPSTNRVLASLDFIRVVFEEAVTGVDAEDLLIAGLPATELTIVSPREYSFTFPPPPTGTVAVAWAASHGITDDSPRRNPFAGGSWTYTVDPVAGDRADVVISEFLASNATGLRDEEGARSDWLELHNRGDLDADLEGWCLTDNAGQPTQWRFPAVRLAAGEYLLVWASGKNRRQPGAPLHTSFSLAAGGEYLALLDARTNVVSAFAPLYPAQQADISYGRDAADPGITGYFPQPTPGAANTTSGPGFAEPPAFSHASGAYTNLSLTLALTAAPDTTLRLTYDGSVPTSNSPAYTGPITFASSVMLKVRAFPTAPGLFPSPVLSRSFVMLDASTRQFTSQLPMVVLTTPNRAIPENVPPGQPRQPGTLLVVDTFRGRSALTATPDYHGWADLEIFGQTSSGFPKKPHRIELQDEARLERSAGLLGMPADGDWRLRNPYSDKCLLNDFLGQELFEGMGHYAVRRRLVEVFVNTSGGKLTYPRDYYGVMVLLENIERGADRVDLARLTPDHNQEPEITGGYIWKKDKDSTGDLNFSTAGGGNFGGQTLKIHEPKPRYITPAQLDWLRTYLNRMEQALYAVNWRTATGTNHYSHYLDVDSFVGQHWIVEFTKQIDGYRLSNYMQKDRGGKVKMEPIWDWNLAFGNADYLEGGRTNGWYYSQASASDHIWLRRLICGTTGGGGTSGDPEFNQRIADRWAVLRTNVFAADRLLARIDELAELLGEAAARDFAKFPRLGAYVWPNPNGAAGGWDVDYVTPTTYAGIISEMKRWVAGRHAWIDSQFLPPPQFDHPGGAVPTGFPLHLLNLPGATIYYTLNGSDPRAAGGGVNPGALTYSGPITITSNVQVTARARRTGTWQSTWGGPARLSLHTALPALRITELMYNPPPPLTGSPYGAQDFEFLEVRNTGAAPLNLLGFRFNQGIQFDFPNLTLAPGQRTVVVGNRPAFESRYGTSALIAGQYEGRLDNAGERLVLLGPLDESIHDFTYDGQWHPIANGGGFSIVTVNETGPFAQWGQAAGWRPSGVPAGSPGGDDPANPTFPQVVISEVLSRPPTPLRDFIELHNAGLEPADVGGWFLTDSFSVPKKFQIPNGTVLAPGGFVAFTDEAFGGPNAGTPFGLSADGEEAYLFSGNAASELTGYVHGFAFGPAAEAVSFGRHVTTNGEQHFVAQTALTFGDPNAGPRTGPVVVSEIMYQPPPVFTNGAFWNNTEDEYLVLHNLTTASVSLHGWRVQDAVDFVFPADATLQPRGTLVLVGFDPSADPMQMAAFRAKFGVPPETLIAGPFSGNLNNAGEAIALLRQDGEPGGAGSWILMDEVHYAPDAPWPASAAGQGDALHRFDPAAYGNDPAAWIAAPPHPGVSPLMDTDGDGMPDLWELRHALNPDAPQDASLDLDLDGLTNREEYLAGTDPRDPASVLRLEEIRVASDVTLRFTAVPRRSYVVQFTDSLAAGSWATLATVPPRATTRAITPHDPNQVNTRYYRVRVEPEP